MQDMIIDYIERVKNNNKFSLESVHRKIDDKIEVLKIKTIRYSLEEFTNIINKISIEETNKIMDMLKEIYIFPHKDVSSERTVKFFHILNNYFDYGYVCYITAMINTESFFPEIFGVILLKILENKPEYII